MDRKSLFSSPILHKRAGFSFPSWKDLKADVRLRGDDSFMTNLSPEISKAYHAWLSSFLHDLGATKNSYVDSSIALAMKNVAPHTDTNVGGLRQERIGATFLVTTGKLELYAGATLQDLDNHPYRMEEGDLITFHDEEHLHMVLAEKKWFGVAGQVYVDD